MKLLVMPNPTFCSFVSNFWHSIDCKKIKFGSVYSILVEKCLKILIEDGYVKDYVVHNYIITVEGISLDIRLKYNSIILYSTSWKILIFIFRKKSICSTECEKFHAWNSFGYFCIK